MILRDEVGEIQIYVRVDLLGEDEYELVKKGLDVGDTVVATGTVFKTRTEEISVEVSKFQWVNKALIPLPEKFHGLTDSEIRYRKRHMDMISDPEVLSRFKIRNKIIKATREFLWSKDYETEDYLSDFRHHRRPSRGRLCQQGREESIRGAGH